MSYVKPGEVISPKEHWKLIAVLWDGGPGEIAYAIGEWDDVPRIGVRWNGIDDDRIGNPQSRGFPTWMMLDPEIYLAIIQKLPEKMQILACRHLGINESPVVEIVVHRHSSGRHTLMKRASGQQELKDSLDNKRLFGNLDRADFLAALYEDVRVHLDAGTRVVLHDLPD